jgi:hydroxymethylbilane synthase
MTSLQTIRILSRKSDLAVIQARQVGVKIEEKFSDVKIEYITKKTLGDIDLTTPLAEMGSAGVFTDDLRNDLIKNECDLAVHSWKDLPLDLGADTILAGTLERADQRDILFVKKDQISKIIKNKSIIILSSSPRRVYNLDSFIKDYLPFNSEQVLFENIRGNIPSRFKKFLEGSGDGLIMAKAAIDRLLNNNINEFQKISKLMKENINRCLWVITPLSQNPTSPGQGALGIEVRCDNLNVINIIKSISDQKTLECVNHERNILRAYGGGCHQKIGVSFFPTFFGLMKSKKGETDNGDQFYSWKQHNNQLISKERVKESEIYPPSLSVHQLFSRTAIKESVQKINSLNNHCVWISRKSALPANALINKNNIIWTSGMKTWKSLARRGIWVNGTADGMGENFDPKIESLTSHPWIKLTHGKASLSKIDKTIATYNLKELPIEEGILNKKYFYWMSATTFNYVVKQFPEIIKEKHACGPGNTYEEIKKTIKNQDQLTISLSYDSWRENLLNDS